MFSIFMRLMFSALILLLLVFLGCFYFNRYYYFHKGLDGIMAKNENYTLVYNSFFDHSRCYNEDNFSFSRFFLLGTFTYFGRSTAKRDEGHAVIYNHIKHDTYYWSFFENRFVNTSEIDGNSFPMGGGLWYAYLQCNDVENGNIFQIPG